MSRGTLEVGSQNEAIGRVKEMGEIADRRQRALLIGAVADHERDALFGLGRALRRGRQRRDQRQQGKAPPHQSVHRILPFGAPLASEWL